MEQGECAGSFNDLATLGMLLVGKYKIKGRGQPVGISLAQMQCGKRKHLAKALISKRKSQSEKCEVLETKIRKVR
jgi:hypothetical protein